MTHELLKLAHILVMSAWLGLEFAMFMLFSWHRRDSITPDDRRLLARVHESVSFGPKIFWAPMLAIGVALTSVGRWAFTGSVGVVVVPAASVLAAGWLAGQVYVFRARLRGTMTTDQTKRVKVISQVDTAFRWSVVAVLLVVGISSLATGEPIAATWLAWKVTLFPLLIASSVTWKRVGRMIGQARQAVIDGAESARGRYGRLIRTGQLMLVGQWTVIVALAWIAISKPG